MIAALLLRFWPYIGLAILSGLLYWSVSNNGKLSGRINELDGVIAGNLETISTLRSAEQFSEVIVVKGLTKRETIHNESVRKPVREIREVIKQLPETDCIVQRVDPDAYCLLTGTC